MSLIKARDAARAEHAVERLGILLWRLRIVAQHLADADDGVQRRAQLVAHVGEELRFVLACFGELAAFFSNFVEQPHVLDGNDRLVRKVASNCICRSENGSASAYNRWRRLVFP